jgi:hypothetical protein
MKLPQLSLRELFLLVVIAAMGCGWWVERTRLIAELAPLRRQREFDLLIPLIQTTIAPNSSGP